MKLQKATKAIFCMAIAFCLGLGVFALASGSENSDASFTTEEERMDSLAGLADTLSAKVSLDAFAGVYFGTDGILNLCIVEGSKVDTAALVGKAYSNDVKIHTVKYSLAALEAARDALDPYMAQFNMAAWGPNVITNRLELQLFEKSDEIYSVLKQLGIDESMVIISIFEGELRLPIL